MSAFKLLRVRRFLPFFVVQFFGALNDNIFKNALVIMVAFRAASEAESGMIINIASGLFILPFFLFSGVAGQIADKLDKASVMKVVKIAEIGIMLVGSVGFYLGSNVLLLFTLFLMGVHSSFFGPAKYSILPQHLKENELVAGNALVEMGTFLAILIGTIAGGILAGKGDATLISIGILGVAVCGMLVSRFIPSAAPSAPDLKLKWNPFTETLALTRLVRKKEAVLNSIMGISWYWYYGATMLTQLPNFTKHFINGDESVVTLLLAVFAISIGFGSMLCERLSGGEIELGLVPFGSLGMTLFVADLFFVNYVNMGSSTPLHFDQLFSGPAAATNIRVIVDLTLVGIFSSFFIVPLYALIQHRSDPDSRSRVIAANNIYNSVFMVVSAIVGLILYQLKFNTVAILLFTAVLNAVVCAYIYYLIPEFVLRFVTWVLATTTYRVSYQGRDHIPRVGPAVIVCNHISFIDWFIITAACRRPVRFVMDHHFFKMPGLGWLFRAAKAIPIAPAKEDGALKEKAFERIAWELQDGNLVCIFPEGKITRDGALAEFRPGIERILRSDPVPVIPMGLSGLWGSFFSRKDGSAMQGTPHPSRRKIAVEIGAPLPPTTTAKELEKAVGAMVTP